MRPRRGDTCAATDATRACPERYAAVQRGEFLYQDYVGWLWLHPKVDRVTPWDFCPWCGCDLPTLAEEDDPEADVSPYLVDDDATFLEQLRHVDGVDFYDGEDGG